MGAIEDAVRVSNNPSPSRLLDPPSRLQLRGDADAYIRELIISGQAAPGTMLRLAGLSSTLEISATPVREALLLLAQDGWVVQEQNRGFRVVPIRRSDVRDVYFVHAFVAGELAARAAARRTKVALATLRNLDADVGLVDADNNPRAHAHAEQLGSRLHEVIYAQADSPRLTSFIQAATRFVPRRLWTVIPGWLEHNRIGHVKIIDALEARDGEGARELMSAHIRTAGDLLIRHLDSVDFWHSGDNIRR